MKQFEDVRKWKEIRGVGGNPQEDEVFVNAISQYNRVLQEVNEILDALVEGDEEEFQDAIGDSIVTLINLSSVKGYKAEDCLDKAFGVIRNRKGITQPHGGFVRYGKLSDEDKRWCDDHQGNYGNEYFTDEMLNDLTKSDFFKD